MIVIYAILRFAKHKGGSASALEAHHERTKEKYASNPDIDTARSKDNFHIVAPEMKYRRQIDSLIKESSCRTRKDSTRFVDTLITASPEFFENRSKDEVAAFFKRAATFLCSKISKKNIISAVVHMDEKTPHMHLIFVPLTKDNRLSAKDILGNRAQLSKWQDDFHSYMAKEYPKLERGKLSRETGRKHIPMRIFKQSVKLTKEAEKIESLLDSINIMNASKKKEEVIILLHKWFPQMESFETQLRKYQKTIELLEKEKSNLRRELDINKESKMQHMIEVSALKSEYQRLRRVVDKIPPEIRKQLKTIDKTNRKDR